MKTIVIFNDNESKFAGKCEFGGKSALELSENWAKSLGFESYRIKAEKVSELFENLSKTATENDADAVLYAYSDCPFLNVSLTKQLVQTHYEYKSEYTFADGYPYGFAPEVIDAGTLRILNELAKNGSEGAAGACGVAESFVTRESIFDFIKTDINSFDIESIIAPQDWRLFRFAFHCGTKDNFLQCKSLFENSENFEDVDKLSEVAAKIPGCLKTVPGFYNIQVSGSLEGSNCIYVPELKKSENMKYEDFASLIEKIADFSENAVISLSAWGEPFENPDCLKMIEKVLSYEGLSVFIETNGLLVDENLCEKLSKIVNTAKKRTHSWQKIMVAVKIDSFTAQTYQKIHNRDTFAQAVSAVQKLSAVIPGCVYPQFVRMNENEEELEGFYRYWNEKSNASGGNMIIQKYEDFAGLLPPRKPADLSPVDRNICWHLRRDLTILSNGNVLPCRACVMSGEIGNIFTENLDSIWKKLDKYLIEHINQSYSEKCRKCDEFYTFNF